MSELLAIGQPCSHPACSLVDFLPLKCQHCTKPFCSDHFKPLVHSCEKFDVTKHDRVAPACPFCQKPVAFAPGVDPNIAMESHFESGCEVVANGALVGMKSKAGGSSGAGASPRCARTKCNKVLIAPIRCTTCSRQFCAQHRFPANHKCTTPTASSTPAASTSSLSQASQTPFQATSSFSDSVVARKNAALAAMNRAKASVVAAAKPGSSAKAASSSRAAPQSSPSLSKAPATAASASSSNKTTTPITTPIANPFSQTERLVLPSSSSSAKQIIDNTRPIPERKPSLISPSSTTHFISSSATSVLSSTGPVSELLSSNFTPSPNTSSSTSSTAASIDTNKIRPIAPQSFVPRSIFGAA